MARTRGKDNGINSKTGGSSEKVRVRYSNRILARIIYNNTPTLLVFTIVLRQNLSTS